MKRVIHKVNEIMSNENNRPHSEALSLPLRPDAGGAGRGGKQLKQGCRCYNLRDILSGEKGNKPVTSMNLKN